jgi:hypothetical protein
MEGKVMSNGELKYPKWEAEFHGAVLEFDREKLFEKIQKFETAVFARLQELASDSDHHAERQAISDATATLSTLTKQKLSEVEDGTRGTDA